MRETITTVNDRNRAGRATGLPGMTLILMAFSLVLSACGGGGGNGGGGRTAPPPAPANVPPTADAGADQAAIERGEVQLAGAGSDSDGGTVSYTWSQVSGPSGEFDDTTVADATFTVPFIPVGAEEDIVLRLTVADGQGGSATDEMTITAASADYVVFLAQKDTAGTNELYLYDTQADTIAKLNGTLVAGGNVVDYRISPDGASIAYRADQETDGRFEVYVAAADGSGTTKVNAPMANALSGVVDYRWSPDGSQLVYLADADIDNVNEVYLVDRDGANHAKINGSVGSPPRVSLAQPTWSPDGRYIAQLVIDLGTGRALGINTHDSQAGGFSSVRVTSLSGTASVASFDWAPDSSSIAYHADEDTDGVFELYSAAPDGSGTQKLSAPLLPNTSVSGWSWAPDASRVAYQAVQDTAGAVEIYTVAPDGSDLQKVNAPLVAGGRTFSFQWSPDASRIAYLADQVTDDTLELFASDPDGSNNSTINGPLIASGNVSAFIWSPDSTRIAYVANQDAVSDIEIYVSTSSGGGNTKVNGPLVANGSTFFNTSPQMNMWAPDSTMFTYPADQFTDNVIEHFVSDLSGGGEVQVTRTPVAGGALQTFAEWSVDSSGLIYLSRQDDPNVSELYLATPDGLVNRGISGPLVAGGFVSRIFDWSP